MGIFKIIRNTNDGLEYMYNALNYITHGHTDYDKRYSLNTDIDNPYEQFLLIKKYFGKTSGNPVFHFVVVYDAKSTWGDNIEIAESMSRSIASYFSDRYQLVYCIHKEYRKKKYGGCASIYHAHFVMNSVSYIDGKCSRVIEPSYMLFLNISRKLQEISLGLCSTVLIEISVLRSMKMIYKCNLT